MDGLNALKRMIFGEAEGDAPRPVYPSVARPEGERKRRKPKEEEKPAPTPPPITAEPEPIEDEMPETERKSLFTDEELKNGFRMSVILGEPLGKRGYGMKKRF